ncbi:MAG: MopE-related protein [Myxococcota bacterium]
MLSFRVGSVVFSLLALLAACGPADDDSKSTADADGDGFSADQDCDDDDASVNPEAAEVCDEVDNDCSGAVDDAPEDGRTYYWDADDDGYYGDIDPIVACNLPSGYGFAPDDCDDTNAAIYPDAAEACDGIDNDCDGALPTEEADDDRDGFMACAECDDADGDTFPGAPEVCDALDNDCDGAVDEDATWFRDADSDRYGTGADTMAASCDAPPDGYVANDDDCDDDDRAVSPAATEVCDTADFDEDCDGVADDDDDSTSSVGKSIWHVDADGDGHGDEADAGTRLCDAPEGYSNNADDCDDTTAAISPSEAEVCGDGLDNDCDGGAGAECGPEGEMRLADAAHAHLIGGTTYSFARYVAASAGDVNGDGYDDLIVGADGDDEGGYVAGAAFLVYGPVSGDLDLSLADVKFVGEDQQDSTGKSVAGAGDVDGDGYDDLLISGEQDNSGAAYLVYGPVSGDLDLSLADAKLYGDGEGDRAGAPVASAGDVNGDGYDDLIIGARYDDDGGTDAGAAYVVHGPISGSVALSGAAAKFIGEDRYQYAATSVAPAGDLNGDGHADLILGVPSNSEGGSGSGAAYVVYGPVSGDIDLSLADAKLFGESGDRAGCSVSAGDIDGDGVNDLIIGAYGDNSSPGAAYVVFGPVVGDLDLSLADATFIGEDNADAAGISVASAGDVNGDGFDDVLIGAVEDDDGGEDAGAAYLVYGPVSGELDLSLADVKLTGAGAGDGVGCAVAAAGDVNADGYGDLVVTMCFNEGGAYLVLGGPGL